MQLLVITILEPCDSSPGISPFRGPVAMVTMLCSCIPVSRDATSQC